MTRWNDEQLDALMGEFFAARLAPQLGRAARSVQVRRPVFFRPWVWAAAGGAVAACLAVVWLLRVPHVNPTVPVPPGLGAEQVVTSEPVEVERSTQWQAWDGGTIAVDDHTPVRVLHRRQIDRVQWVDPASGASMESETPRDEVLFVSVHPY